MRTTDRRIVAVGAVAAGLVWTGAGTAAAGPSADRGKVFPTEGAAYGSLPAPDGSLYVHLSVWEDPGGEATAGVEVFGTYGDGEFDYFECFDGSPVSATLDGLDGATAAGSTTLVCGGPGRLSDGVASVSVDVEWEPYGRIDRSVVRVPGDPCISLNKQRAAHLVGDATVSISFSEGSTITATIDDGVGPGDVRTLRGVCPRGRS